MCQCIWWCVYINLSGPLHLCVYMNIRVPVHLNVCAHEHKWTVESLCVVHAHVFACKSQRVTLDFFLSHSTPYFWQGLSLSTELTDLTKQMAIKPQGCSCLILTVLWLRLIVPFPVFYIGAGNLNSGPYDCRTSTLLTAATPQPSSFFHYILC